MDKSTMSSIPTSHDPPVDPEVDARPKRRTFTAEFKAKILKQCDAAGEQGEIGAILRREGLYSSHLTDWRRLRATGGTQALEPKKTGRPPKAEADRAAEHEVLRLRRENATLLERVRRAEIIIEAQKKLAEMLAILVAPTESTA